MAESHYCHWMASLEPIDPSLEAMIHSISRAVMIDESMDSSSSSTGTRFPDSFVTWPFNNKSILKY